MILYRLTSGGYKDDLSGMGPKLYGGRWNSIGLKALYTAEYISLAVLEVLVHIKKYNLPLDYHLVSIHVPDNTKPATISKEKLRKNWKDDVAYSQFMGDEFLKSNQALLLKVPSVIVDQEHNYILNPVHPDAQRIKIVSTSLFEFDKRLYLTNE